MTAAQQPEQDGNLPAARRKLSNTISQLIDPKPNNRTLDNGTNRIEWVDSLYDQLTDALPGGQGNGGTIPQSSPPMCIDAVDILTRIEKQAAQWHPRPELDAADPNPNHISVIRLQQLDRRTWRPQDVEHIDTITTTINAWCEEIRALLNPQPKWTLPNPCPACDTAIVYRRNSAGETVRQPALQIGPTGCKCQKCNHTWAPEFFRHLAGVLGYELPTGVLE